ncbi:MAG: hypothetical protein ABFD29_05165 [Anaerolineaceae bacterium]|jgi:hypothetical protein
MIRHAIFNGLVFDENDNPIETKYVGDDPCYVIDDQGFKRHILAETVDRQVLNEMLGMMEGHEDIIGEQTAKMLGQEDLFTRAVIINQLKQMDQQFEKLFETGIPEDAKAYLGMMGFKIIIDMHGNLVELRQPGATIDPEDE